MPCSDLLATSGGLVFANLTEVLIVSTLTIEVSLDDASAIIKLWSFSSYEGGISAFALVIRDWNNAKWRTKEEIVRDFEDASTV